MAFVQYAVSRSKNNHYSSPREIRMAEWSLERAEQAGTQVFSRGAAQCDRGSRYDASQRAEAHAQRVPHASQGPETTQRDDSEESLLG